MKNILVPTDFSANAKLALEYAGNLAAKARAQIIIMHCGEFYQEMYARDKELIREHNEYVVTDLHQKLNGLKKSIENDFHINATICLYKDGGVTESILQGAKDYKADVIVMGTYGATGLRRKLFGSKAAEVINTSKVPVLTIPPDYQWLPPLNIALAVEDTLQPIHIVKPVFDLADLFQGKVSVVVFSEETETFELVTHSRTAQIIEQKIKSVYKTARLEFVHLVGSRFQEAVQEYIAKNNIDMLAMITRRRSFFQNIFDSSLTQKISYEVNVPLLSLHLPE